MAIFQTLPFEALEFINSYLLPRDIAALSLTCQNFQERLGSGNQYFWYRILRQALIVPGSGRSIPRKIASGIVNLQEFKEGWGYWKEASDLFSGRKTYACRYCLEADPVSRQDGGRSYAFKSKGAVFGGDTIQQFCAKCRRDWFTDLKTFTSGFPDFKVPTSIYHPVYGEYLITIPSLIKHIETQGTSYATITSASYKFKSKWLAPGLEATKWSASLGQEDAEYIDQALCLLRESYQQDYRHLHIALPPNGYYNLLTFTLYKEVLGHLKPHPSDVVIFSENIIKHIMAFIPILKAQKTDTEAINLAATFNREFLGDPKDFSLMYLKHPDSGVIRGLLEPLTNPSGSFNWMLVYSRAYFESTANDVRCYWCLRENGGKDTETNRFRYHSFISKDPQHVPWITSHIISKHSDFIFVRPKNDWVHNNFRFWSFLYGRHHVIDFRDRAYLSPEGWERLKIKPDFENEKLERFQVNFPTWCEGWATPSEYFMM
ncbi:hypothetical protein TWF506_008395 [Arthrobotrys conoides]|uniref:F-box domain-containing protein n=1 Tax=Arthrobotrys conoides TaxID=74498 RepID=A0AAN8RMQ1_9PEZI